MGPSMNKLNWRCVRGGLHRAGWSNFGAEIERGQETRVWWWAAWTSRKGPVACGRESSLAKAKAAAEMAVR